jgi:hypothetical protein
MFQSATRNGERDDGKRRLGHERVNRTSASRCLLGKAPGWFRFGNQFIWMHLGLQPTARTCGPDWPRVFTPGFRSWVLRVSGPGRVSLTWENADCRDLHEPEEGTPLR